MVTNEAKGSWRALSGYGPAAERELAILIAHEIISAANRLSNQKQASPFRVPVNEAR